jgi:hypothetical protein
MVFPQDLHGNLMWIDRRRLVPGEEGQGRETGRVQILIEQLPGLRYSIFSQFLGLSIIQ